MVHNKERKTSLKCMERKYNDYNKLILKSLKREITIRQLNSVCCKTQLFFMEKSTIQQPPGFNPTNKKPQKNSQNSGKIFRLLKIPPSSTFVLLSKIPRKNLQKNFQLAAPKILPEFFFSTNLWIKNFLNLSEHFSELRFFLDSSNPSTITFK
jgi:hypothetical protein